MKTMIARFAIIITSFFFLGFNCFASLPKGQDVDLHDTISAGYIMPEDTMSEVSDVQLLSPGEQAGADGGFYKELKTKFIEGDVSFMSLIALVLVVGLSFCIERIIFLSLSEIDSKRFMNDLSVKIENGEIDAACEQCRDTRGPVAAICCQGLLRIDESMENIERSVASYGSVQSANLEKGCSWITMLINMATSLGFLGTVIGIVISFGQMQSAGDISTAIVASGMKVALITTIFGIIVALVLQLFYNYILSKIDHITYQMEESAISLLDAIMRYKSRI